VVDPTMLREIYVNPNETCGLTVDRLKAIKNVFFLVTSFRKPFPSIIGG
jgi:hypothetical protein